MPSTAWTSPYRFVRPRTRMTGPPAGIVVTGAKVPPRIGGDGRVVAHRLVEAVRLGAVVAGRDLDEGGSELPGHQFGLGHEPMNATTLTRAGVDHEREDADDAVVVLESRQGVERDEPQQRALVFRDHDTRVLGREAAEPLDDVARTGWISRIVEEGRDRLGVARLRRPDRQRRVGRLRHGSMVAGITMSRNCPRAGGTGARSAGRNGPATAAGFASSVACSSQVAAQPSPCRARNPASLPS